MIVKQIAHIIAEYAVFLELTDEDALNPDTAVDRMEGLAYDLEHLDRGFLRELLDAFAEIAPEFEGEAQEVVRNIAYSYHLEDLFAEDDPVRLAELEALRDARYEAEQQGSAAALPAGSTSPDDRDGG